jgi:hypothetical protein
LSLVGVLKKKLQYKLPIGNDDLLLAFIQNVFRSLKQMLIPDNVRNPFKMLGFEFNIAKSPYTLLLREEKLRGSQEIPGNVGCRLSPGPAIEATPGSEA